jgi:hypothetical protein
MKRLMQDAMPQLLSGNAQMLREINTHLDEVKAQTGIDLRQFEQVAVGVNFKQAEPKKFDFEPVVLARGKLNLVSLLLSAQKVAAGKFREEKIGNKVVYVFQTKEILQANKPVVASGPNAEEKFNTMLSRIPAEIAATAFDTETLPIGTLEKVREIVSGTSHISPEILSLVSRQPNALASFGANVPAGMSQFWGLDNDELGKSVDSIRLLSGAMDTAGGMTTVAIAAKTYKPEQAKSLEDNLIGLQSLGKGLLGGMKGDDKQVYARMVESAKIARAADEVTINMKVSNSDINVLLGKM